MGRFWFGRLCCLCWILVEVHVHVDFVQLHHPAFLHREKSPVQRPKHVLVPPRVRTRHLLLRTPYIFEAQSIYILISILIRLSHKLQSLRRRLLGCWFHGRRLVRDRRLSRYTCQCNSLRDENSCRDILLLLLSRGCGSGELHVERLGFWLAAVAFFRGILGLVAGGDLEHFGAGEELEIRGVLCGAN
jgi:hypothetical protein